MIHLAQQICQLGRGEVLAAFVSLDGDGTTTYMITCAAMLPLYKRIGMNPMILATIAMLSLSIMSGMSPWGGPATRAIAALGLDATDYFIPMLPTVIGGAAWVVFTAYLLGRAERRRYADTFGATHYVEYKLGSELIVIGRRRQPWLLDRLERSLSHQLMARVRGDLLHGHVDGLSDIRVQIV